MRERDDQACDRADIVIIGKEAQPVLDGTGKGMSQKIGGLDCLSRQNFGRVPLRRHGLAYERSLIVGIPA
jgi:hypothetical protein